MGRMMPGRIRQEGIDLYEAGQLTVLQSKNGKMELILPENTLCMEMRIAIYNVAVNYFRARVTANI